MIHSILVVFLLYVAGVTNRARTLQSTCEAEGIFGSRLSSSAPVACVMLLMQRREVPVNIHKHMRRGELDTLYKMALEKAGSHANEGGASQVVLGIVCSALVCKLSRIAQPCGQEGLLHDLPLHS